MKKLGNWNSDYGLKWEFQGPNSFFRVSQFGEVAEWPKAARC